MMDFSTLLSNPNQLILYFFSFISLVMIGRKVVEFFLIRAGYIKASFLLANRRKITAWKKPQSDNIKHKGKSFSFDIKKMTFEGSTPEVFYNFETGDQMDFFSFEKGVLSSTLFDKLLNEMFNLGKDYMRRSQDKLQKMLNLILLVMLGVCGLLIYIVYTMSNK